MLLDHEMREPLAAGLPLQEDRAKTERLLLRLAIGAATERLWLSYPRIDVGGARPRVPSFYVLDIMRAITGHIPNHEALQRRALVEGGAKLDWPAPARPRRRHRRRRARPRDAARSDRRAEPGRGEGSCPLSAAAERRAAPVRDDAVGPRTIALAAAGRLVRVAPGTKAMLASQRLGARPYSLSALQKFATCPYQFLLSAIYRLEPNDEPEPLQRLDPSDTRRALSRGPGGVLPFHAGRRTAAARRGGHAPGAPAGRSHARRRGRCVSRAAGAGHRPRVARRDRRAGARPPRVGPEAAGRARLAAHLFRVQLRAVGRRARSPQRQRAGHDRRTLPPARLGRPRRAAARTARRSA